MPMWQQAQASPQSIDTIVVRAKRAKANRSSIGFANRLPPKFSDRREPALRFDRYASGYRLAGASVSQVSRASQRISEVA